MDINFDMIQCAVHKTENPIVIDKTPFQELKMAVNYLGKQYGLTDVSALPWVLLGFPSQGMLFFIAIVPWLMEVQNV